MTSSTNTTADSSTLHLFGLRRSSVFAPPPSTTTASFDNEDDHHHHHHPEVPIDKELLEVYGTRVAAIKAAMVEQARRITRDPEEFKHLQARLRSRGSTGAACSSDAWLKQNLPALCRAHAREAELRHAARLQIQAAELLAQRQQQQQQQQQQVSPSTRVSPTSVTASFHVDAAFLKEHVTSPPLAAAAEQWR